MTIADIARNALRTIDNNSPLILTGLTVAGVVSTGVLAAKGAYSAAEAIRDDEYKSNGLYIKAGPKRRLQLVWHFFVPAFGTGIITCAAAISAQSINSQRQAALIGGITIADSAFREYQKKVTEILGVKKEEQIHDEIVKDQVEAHPYSSQVFITGSGEVRCSDVLSGRYFNSDKNTLEKAEIAINRRCMNDMYASQNDFYRLVGLPINGYGEEYGWSIDVPLELVFSTVLSEDDVPCLSIDYRMHPIRGYNQFG